MRLRHKEKGKVLDEKQLGKRLEQELSTYVKRDDLKEYLATIEKDKNKKALWDSLSAHKKVRLLRYVLVKKGEQHDKK